MRSCRFLALVSGALLLPFAPGSMKGQGPVDVPVQPRSGGRLIVAVMVNHEGPYRFLVDTGASMTIVDAALFRDLGVRTEGEVALASFRDTNRQRLGILDEISVGGLSVSPVSVLAVPSLDIGSIHVRGILGENFLNHFDLLIDNQHGRIRLDAGSALVEELVGERLPVTFDEGLAGQGIRVRPTVAVTLPAYGAQPLRLLLDSAADTVMIRAPKDRQRRQMRNGSESRVNVRSIYGVVACDSWEDELQSGSFHASRVRMTDCGPARSDKMGDEGSLPTSGFRQILVSHSGGFVVLNPSRRVLTEVADGRARTPAQAMTASSGSE